VATYGRRFLLDQINLSPMKALSRAVVHCISAGSCWVAPLAKLESVGNLRGRVSARIWFHQLPRARGGIVAGLTVEWLNALAGSAT
jgi:hypothetical protein